MDKDAFTNHIAAQEIDDAEKYREDKNTAILVIMFIDAVSSTALMEKIGAVEYLKIQRSVKKKITAIIEHKSEGKVIKDLGDGLLAIFAVPGVSVERALDIQELLMSEPDYKVRIGLDMGQVIRESDDHMSHLGSLQDHQLICASMGY